MDQPVHDRTRGRLGNQEKEPLRNPGLDNYVEFGIHRATNPPEAAGQVLDTVPRITGRPGRTFTKWAQENTTNW